MTLAPKKLVAFLAVSLVGCSASSGSSTLTNAELDGLSLRRSALTETVATPTSGATALHLKVAFGLLAKAEKGRDSGWVTWDGSAKVSAGTASAESRLYTEKGDDFTESGDATVVQWQSKTRPHFDVYVMKMAPGAATDTVTVTLPQVTKTLDVAALAAGYEERFAVGDAGHEVALSAVPDEPCAGFSFGYLKVTDGALDFGGLLTDASGATLGRLRFSGTEGELEAHLTQADGAELASGAGTYDATAKSFTLALAKADGTALGGVSGLYAEPSYAARGSYSGHLACP